MEGQQHNDAHNEMFLKSTL